MPTFSSIRFRSLFAISAFVIVSCNQSRREQQLLQQDRFDAIRQQFNALIQLLKADTVTWKDGWRPPVPSTEFQQPIREQLQQLGVTQVVMFSWPECRRNFDLILNWDKHIPLHAQYNACDSVSTRRGAYIIDKYANEVWGMGEYWALWTEVKLRDAKM